MSDQAQRPLRPDDKEELARFHNGDTLDNIPVIRIPQARPNGSSSARWVALIACVGVFGGLVGAGVAYFSEGRDGHTITHAPETSVSAPKTKGAGLPASPPSSPSTPTQAASTLGTVTQATLEQVRIIQTPPTGGDPGSTFCLVYTGSSSGTEREAILLMNAPGYQCQDLLPYDGINSPFSTEAPNCQPPSREAVLSFAETGGWDEDLMYTCLTKNHGA